MPLPTIVKNLCATLLVPPARLYGLGMRLSRRLASRHVPDIPCVGVGGMRRGMPGTVLVTSWLLGWAGHHGLRAAVATSPLRGGHDGQTLRATPDGDPSVIDAQALALAMYAPKAAVLFDARPERAARSAHAAFRPDILIAHDVLSFPALAAQPQIVILGLDDLTTGFGRPVPAGRWREDASALRRADIFVISMPPPRFAENAALIDKRLSRFERPVAGVSPRAWRLRQAAGRTTATDLGGEPYLLVTAESERRTAPWALSALLPAPRLSVIFPDNHRFTVQDLRQILADASRLKCPHVVCPPVTAIRLAPRLAALEDSESATLWTYDPDVIFTPFGDGGPAFRDWWQDAWARLAGSAPESHPTDAPGAPGK